MESTMFMRPSDFIVEHAHGSFSLSFKDNGGRVYISGYKDFKDVQRVIDTLTNPEVIARPVYDGTCHCLNKHWQYYEENKEHIVFKVCTVCNRPLDREVLKHFNQDFDLDAFIAGDI